MFNDRTLRQLRVTKEQFFADGDGLYIRVTPKGQKTFVYRSQAGGKSRWRVIGRYPVMSLLEARNRVAEGVNVSTKTVAETCEEYLPRLCQRYKTHEEITRSFRVDVLPAIGHLRVDRVTRLDCSNLLQVIVARGAHVAANRTLSHLRSFFYYCKERGWCNENPTDGITKRSVGGRERPKKRSLSEQELTVLIEKLMSGRFPLKSKLAVGLLLITGTRTSEVLGVSKKEVSKFWWILPAERTKSVREHKIYLSPQARFLFKLAFKHFGATPFRGLGRTTLSQTVRRLPISPPISPHKFRHTMATRLTDLGVAPHIAEKMLNHQLGELFEIYNHAEFLPERRAAWRLWGAYLAKLRRATAQRPGARTPGSTSSLPHPQQPGPPASSARAVPSGGMRAAGA